MRQYPLFYRAERSQDGLWLVAGGLGKMFGGKRDGFGRIFSRQALRNLDLGAQVANIVFSQFAVQGKPPQCVLLP
jgi:hypothetical protein